jgi:hypothetical protein
MDNIKIPSKKYKNGPKKCLRRFVKFGDFFFIFGNIFILFEEFFVYFFLGGGGCFWALLILSKIMDLLFILTEKKANWKIDILFWYMMKLIRIL